MARSPGVLGLLLFGPDHVLGLLLFGPDHAGLVDAGGDLVM
jgi:hypothetical protein